MGNISMFQRKALLNVPEEQGLSGWQRRAAMQAVMPLFLEMVEKPHLFKNCVLGALSEGDAYSVNISQLSDVPGQVHHIVRFMHDGHGWRAQYGQWCNGGADIKQVVALAQKEILSSAVQQTDSVVRLRP